MTKTRKVPFTEDLCQEREKKTLQIRYLGGFGGLILMSGSMQISCECPFCPGLHFSQFKEDDNNTQITKILGQQNFCCEGLTLGRGTMDWSGCFQGKRNNYHLTCSVIFYCSSANRLSERGTHWPISPKAVTQVSTWDLIRVLQNSCYHNFHHHLKSCRQSKNYAVACVSCRKIFLKEKLGDVGRIEEGGSLRRMTQPKQMGVERGHRSNILLPLRRFSVFCVIWVVFLSFIWLGFYTG